MHTAAPSEVRPIRVLIVENSAVFRHLLARELTQAGQIQIVGSTPDPALAWDMIDRHKPDVVLLDASGPTPDAIPFLRRLMQYRPTPVIVMGSATARNSQLALDVLEAGAVEWLNKPGPAISLDDLMPMLIQKIKAVSGVCARKLIAPRPSSPMPTAPTDAGTDAGETILAIGASTGGMRALAEVLTRLPANAPGTVVVQHLPAHLTTLFANRLSEQCAVEVREAMDGDRILPGRVLLAPGGSHMLLRRSSQGYRVEVKDGPELLHQKPSIDVLFNSIAKTASAVGAILTGTGVDGAAGLMNLRRAGNHTIAQDQETSVAFGLPAEAIRRGAAEKIVPLQEVAPMLMQLAAPAPVQ
jgi:two-component system chemotaxis response regulator CheB